MWNRAWRRVALTVAAVIAVPLAVPGGLAARQTKAGTTDGPNTEEQLTDQQLMDRVDALAPLAEEARAAARGSRRAAFARAERETAARPIGIGPIHVLVFPGDEDLARDVIGRVWKDDYASWTTGSPDFERYRMFFQWSRDPKPFNERELRDVRKVEGSWQSRGYMERGVREVLGTWLRDELAGTALADWVTAPVRAPSNPASVFRHLARAPSQAARACVSGDSQACLVVTGLQIDDYPIDDWYGPDERRYLVATKRDDLGAFPHGQLEACLGGDNATCDGLLEEVGRGRDAHWAEPVHGDVRNSLLWFALQTGGTGAWDRLLAAADQGPRAALEAASGLDAVTLAGRWRDDLLRERPASHAGLGGTALGAAFWILVLALLAARSSRWRFA